MENQEWDDDLPYDEEEEDGRPAGFLDSLQDQFGASPWWVTSAVIHALVLALMATIVIMSQQTKEDATVIQQAEVQKKPPEKKEREVRDIVKQEKVVKHDEQVDNPVIVHEKVEIDDHMVTENDIEMDSAQGQEDAISDIPMGGTGLSGNIGVSGGGGGAYGFRTGGGKRRAAMRNGGSKKTESAVDAALEWLARHQETNGSWSCTKHGGKRDAEAQVGVTGAAVLAFLGAGHTEKTGKYKNTVRRGIAYLVSRQNGNGMVGVNGGHKHGGGYNHAMGGLALAEAFGMARVPSTGAAAQKAIDFSCLKHQRKQGYGGWRYNPNNNDADLSVTGWFIMQLKSAKVAGLKVPGTSFQGALEYVESCETEGDGDGSYGGGLFSYQPGKGVKTTITAVGLLGKLFLGFQPKDVLGGAERLRDNLPQWGSGDFYYWYYGTLVMFQCGGDYWNQWNVAMKNTLLSNQVRGGDDNGSWDPQGGHDKAGGRAWTTAAGALSLEVYYRYLPMYR